MLKNVLVKSLHIKNVETIIFSDNEILLFSTNFDETLVKIRLILFLQDCNFQLSQIFNLAF